MTSVKKSTIASNYSYTNEKAIAKFWSYVNVTEVEDCWEWKGKGAMTIAFADENKKVILLSGKKFMYSQVMDTVPAGRLPSLKCLCANKKCLNPTHYDLKVSKLVRG